MAWLLNIKLPLRLYNGEKSLKDQENVLMMIEGGLLNGNERNN